MTRENNPNYPFKPPRKVQLTDAEIRALRDERFRAMGIPVGKPYRRRPSLRKNRFVPAEKTGEPRMGLALTETETRALLAVLTARNPLLYDTEHEALIAPLLKEIHTMASRRGWLTELLRCDTMTRNQT